MATAPRITTEIAWTEDWNQRLGEILPAQGSWSEQEYLVLTDRGNRLVEYTDGFLEFLPLPTDKHQAILGCLYLALCQYCELRGAEVHFSPLRLQIRPGKFREPDLLLLRSANDSRRQNRFWIGADFVVEVVSEEKPERDLIEKWQDYAEGRVPEYWIVNPQTEAITVLELRGQSYEEVGIYQRGDIASSALLGEFAVVVDAVFDAGVTIVENDQSVARLVVPPGAPARPPRLRPPVTGVPKPGQYEGRLVVPDDFGEPLEELRDYMG